MSEPKRLLIASFLFAVLSTLTLAAADFRRYEQIIIDKSNIVHEQGLAYSAPFLSDLPSDSVAFHSSRVRLTENGNALGPAHTYAGFIGNSGGGAYIHLADRVVFSASDNSDPAANNAVYALLIERALPGVVVAGVFAVAMLALVLAWYCAEARVFAKHRVGCGLSRLVVAALALGFCAELAGRTALNDMFLRQGEFVQAVHDQVFGIASDLDIGWMASRFSARPYTMYGLNPDSHRWVAGETNADYLVRRKEPIRPRDQVSFRVLVIGGSTTYDDQIIDETNTWVFRLERSLRERYGDGVDVINGGVGGYTIYENLINYATSLNFLDADVVLLFEGINDVHPRLYPSYDRDYRSYTRAFWNPEHTAITRNHSLLRFSAAYRWLYMAIHYQQLQRTGIAGLVREPYPPVTEWRTNLKNHPPTYYERALYNFATLVTGRGGRIGIIPQYFIPRSDADLIFSVGVHENNEVNQAVAEKLGLPYMEAILKNGAFENSDTNDNCHFNERGAMKMASMVEAFMSHANLLPPR